MEKIGLIFNVFNVWPDGKNCLKQNGFIIIWKTFQIIHPDANCYY